MVKIMAILSQYRRSSRQCNLYASVSTGTTLRLNTAEAVDNVILLWKQKKLFSFMRLNTAEAVDNVIF